MADEDREALTQLLRAQLAEQSRARRWKLFFRFAFLGLLAILVVKFVTTPTDYMPQVSGEHIALVRLEGAILSGTGSVGGGSARKVSEALRDAFETENARAVILEINTPAAVLCSRHTLPTKSYASARSIPISRCTQSSPTSALPAVCMQR